MFKRLYISTVFRNIAIFLLILPLLSVYAMTMIYRIPNQQKERIINQIYSTGSDSVLETPIFSEYNYFYLDVNNKGEVLYISDSDISNDELDRYADYITWLYFGEGIKNVAFLFNVQPEDRSFNHKILGKYYYSAKLIESEMMGSYRILVLYTTENAGYFFESLLKIQSLNLVLIALICIVSLLFAFWEVRPAKIAWNEQREFFENASHELRTPVTIISSALEHMNDSQTDEQKQWMDILFRETDRLRQMVNDLMFLARAGAKHARQMKIERRDVRLDLLLMETYISMEAVAIDKGVTFVDFKCGEMDVCGDGEKLRQLTSLLLKNAIENTDAGGTVSLSGQVERSMAVIIVKDTGRGIDKHDLKKIFRRFYRADPYSDSGGNAGLGLAIADRIVKMHKGKILVSSVPGEGSIFTVKIPLGKHRG